MTKENFQDLLTRVRNGDNSALSYLHPFQEDCIRMLLVKSNWHCSQDQAYDLFLDSVLDFRKNVLNDKVEYQNIKAYLRRMCWNKWLALCRTNERVLKKQEVVTSALYENNDPQPGESMEQLYTDRLKQLEQGMQQLSEQCRTILYMAIADDRSMAEIAEHLGLASADVAKTSKSRCYKKLLEIIHKPHKP
jgi:RNA polymerase sigma factor (sigma-70 family)